MSSKFGLLHLNAFFVCLIELTGHENNERKQRKNIERVSNGTLNFFLFFFLFF